jgi:hypothetical protein
VVDDDAADSSAFVMFVHGGDTRGVALALRSLSMSNGGGNVNGTSSDRGDEPLILPAADNAANDGVDGADAPDGGNAGDGTDLGADVHGLLHRPSPILVSVYMHIEAIHVDERLAGLG